MPEIEETCEFTVQPKGIKYTVVPDGDILIITGANIDANNSASLSWLINIPGNLHVEIKKES